ncbi:hypothetical protein ANO11243_043080 [Dothideomycetidae sp. 11243]|nr:hypothetical protein ANO11243_043080 [fungal sp. No.11243]
MMSSSVGSDLFFCFALLFICVLVLLLLRFYLPIRSTPAYLLVPVFLALALPLSVILLVPIDLASSPETDIEGARGIWLPKGVILVAWRISYWLTFLLTWIVLPLLGEYSDSGYREPKDRLIYSLRSNGRYQLIVLGLGVLGGVYFFLSTGFRGEVVKALVMALAYTWGLIMAVYLMGHGLVAIPRRLFRGAKTADRLRRLQAHAPRIHDKLQEAEEELATIEAQVAQLQASRSGLRADLKDWVDEVVEASFGTQNQNRRGISGAPAVITERFLAELTRKLKRARHKRARFQDEWDRLVQKAGRLRAIIDSAGSQRLKFDEDSGGRQWSMLTPYMRYLLHAQAMPWLRVCAAAFLGLASVILIWSEVVRAVSSKLPTKVSINLSVVGLTVIHHPNSSSGQIGVGGQLIAAVWLLYMCTAALYSMSEVKVWGNRALVKRQTYGESACWYSLQVAKLTVPLSYNFITMLQRSIYEQTCFYGFLGKLINLTPLGQGFSEHFPLFILVPVCATLFNLYGKVKNVFGFGVLDDESEENAAGFGTGGWREGQALIDRALQDRPSSFGLSAPPEGGFSDRPSLDSGRNLRNEGRDPLLMPSGVSSNDRGAVHVPDRSSESQNHNEDDGPRYFFQDLGERVRNTLDTVDRPQWLSDLGSSITKPKWMQRDDSGAGGGSSSGWARMFGGQSSSSDGRIRL